MLKQIVGVVVEIATVGAGSTVIVTVPVCGWLQLGVPEVATLTKLYVVVPVNAGVVKVAVPAASKTIG